MLGCTAIRTAGMQPHFSMIHKKGIWTHSEQTNTSSGQRFAFMCLIIINLTAILKIMVVILKMESIALASINFIIRKVWRTNAESVILVSGSAQLL